MYNQALEFMLDIGLVDPPPKYVDALPMWRSQIMENFYERVMPFEGRITL